jgi:hypothetical protein
MRVLIATVLSVSLVSWGAAAQQNLAPQPFQPPQQPPPASVAAPPSLPPPLPSRAAAPALIPQRQGAVNFVSGGTSEDDRATLQNMEGDYNMRFMFAVQPSGEYLADINVTLVDSRGGTVLDTVSAGPLLYARVPPGRYRVTVDSDGRSQTRTLEVAANGVVSQAFYWRQAG